MSKTDYKFEYRRNLPHYQPEGATLFVTTRLAGTLPTQVVWRLKQDAEIQRQKVATLAGREVLKQHRYDQQKKDFARLDDLLDKSEIGPTWLAEPDVARMVCESLAFRDGRVYRLDAYVVMPNHMHILFSPLRKDDGSYHSLSSIMMSLKRWTAGKANKLLGREGQFWQHESYDHIVRDQAEWERIIAYILNNPLKVGLAESWDEWPWSYLREE